MLTGLAFWSPWLFWIAVLFGGATVSRELHPWAGLMFVVATLMMYEMWGKQMRETASDKEFWRAVPHYVRNEDEQVPSADRFNAGQKFLFWGFFWCGILLLLSGVILWFTHLVPWNFRYLRYFAVIIHPAAALLTIGLFIIHVYIRHSNLRLAGLHDPTDDSSAGCVRAHQTLQYRIQISPWHAQQETAARLSIRQQSLLSRSGGVPLCEIRREGKIVVAAARDAVGRNELEDFRADHRHCAGSNLGANATGATHPSKMPEQAKAGHINRGPKKPFLG
jgi:formate dehydrogenase subunit gamma